MPTTNVTPPPDLKYRQVRVEALDKGRRGKHHDLVEGILHELKALAPGSAMEIPLDELGAPAEETPHPREARRINNTVAELEHRRTLWEGKHIDGVIGNLLPPGVGCDGKVKGWGGRYQDFRLKCQRGTTCASGEASFSQRCLPKLSGRQVQQGQRSTKLTRLLTVDFNTGEKRSCSRHGSHRCTVPCSCSCRHILGGNRDRGRHTYRVG